MTSRPILVTGATGYVGGRLIPALLEAGYRVRAMGRSLDKLACRPWAHHEQIELVQGDVLDKASLKEAAKGCRAAYYLVHSMIAQKEKFAEADRRAARNMVAAASATGLERMIYLGGLAEAGRKIRNPRKVAGKWSGAGDRCSIPAGTAAGWISPPISPALPCSQQPTRAARRGSRP